MVARFYVETLGCPKNQVDSDKLVGTLLADGMVATDRAGAADLVVVNTCAFIDAARRESIDTILALDEQRREGSRLVVTGCMAERYGDELAAALPEVDQIAGFGVPLHQPRHPPTPEPGRRLIPVSVVEPPLLDLLNLPRPRSVRPWAYVKIAEGCDRQCGFCAIPSFRGPQRSRPLDAVLAEVDQLDVKEVVLVAQDLASYGRDRSTRSDRAPLTEAPIVDLVRAVSDRVPRVRLLYLYPSDLTDRLVDAVLDTGRGLLRPLAPARLGPAAEAHAPLGQRRSLPHPHRRDPDPGARGRVPEQLHRGLSRRDRGRPRSAVGVRRGGPARLVRVLRLQPGGRDLRRRSRPGRAGVAHERAAGAS